MYTAYLQSPLGSIELRYSDSALHFLSFLDDEREFDNNAHPIFKSIETQLQSYFEGNLKTFDIPLQPEGTEFQKKVWHQLLEIPFGSTKTYLGMAKLLGDEKVIRAAGTANGRNPIGLIIPCHRVIGSDGSLTGYAGGLWRKKWLLDHEAKHSGKAVQGSLFS